MFISQRSVAPLTALLCVFALRATAAQTGASRYSTSLTLTNGLTANQHLDRNASPLAFSGLGYDVGLGYRRGLGRWTFATTLDGARRNSTTTLTAGTPATENTLDGRLAFSAVRELGASASQGFGVGLFADVAGGLTRHHYADPGLTTSDYVHGVASIGPEVTWSRSLAGGMARIDLGTPLIGIVHRPYSDTRQERPSPSLEFATPSSLRAINTGISYESSQRRRLGLFASYRLRVLDLPDQQPYRAISNTISLGIVARLGRRLP